MSEDQLGFDDRKASENLSKILMGRKMKMPFKKLRHERRESPAEEFIEHMVRSK
jgi:hypothetical protein